MRTRLLLPMLSIFVLLFGAISPPAGPRPVRAASFQAEVTLEITFVKEGLCPEVFEVECPGDYYAVVHIDGQRFRSIGEIEDNEFTPPADWTFKKSVDGDKDFIDIHISLQDSDPDVDPNGDDVMDISGGDDDLHLKLDLVTGKVTGEVVVERGEEGSSQGSGGGSPHARLDFKITTSLTQDTDQDGIPDGAELKGFWDDDRRVFTRLHQMGADPCRKTIAVEVDYMGRPFDHGHRPTDGAVTQIKEMFDKAPVPAIPAASCPYSGAGFPRKATGIDIIIDRDSPQNVFEEQEALPLGALPLIGIAMFTPGRGPYFHYVLFIHNQAPGDSTSGRCCVANRHFVVSLGEWTDKVGSDREQAGTFVHELGHALGLDHGGHEPINYKPNYLSAMNYRFQFGTPAVGTTVLDYSREKLPKSDEQLDETKLTEKSSGCIGSAPLGTVWLDRQGATVGCVGDERLDWDGDGTIAGGTVNVDVNGDGLCVAPAPNGVRDTARADDDRAYLVDVAGTLKPEGIGSGDDHACDSPANAGDPDPATAADDVQVLKVGDKEPGPLAGSEDWSRLIFRAVHAPGADRPSINHGPDITFEEARRNQALFTDPDLKAAKVVDKAEAAPGETLTYTVSADNIGLGIAKHAEVSDTLPGGATQKVALADVPPGGSRTAAFTYAIPCTATDGTKLTNSATLSSRNLLGAAEANTTNNSASATSTVRTPILTLAKTATPSVNAAEAITYRITYENAGSGGATNVVVKDTLPAGLYYSTGLDLGAGPKPNDVTVNADGTRTLTWSIGAVAGTSGSRTIEYTARSSLLALGGTSFTNAASLEFQSLGGCTFPALKASATTTITVAPATRDPLGQGFWANHSETWTAEVLARLQATDQSYDTSADGVLSPAEVQAMFAPSRGQPETLRTQLLATYFNLATRRINAATSISSKTADQLQLADVRAAVLYAADTVKLPFTQPNSTRYDDATQVLDDINSNRSGRF